MVVCAVGCRVFGVFGGGGVFGVLPWRLRLLKFVKSLISTFWTLEFDLRSNSNLGLGFSEMDSRLRFNSKGLTDTQTAIQKHRMPLLSTRNLKESDVIFSH